MLSGTCPFWTLHSSNGKRTLYEFRVCKRLITYVIEFFLVDILGASKGSNRIDCVIVDIHSQPEQAVGLVS